MLYFSRIVPSCRNPLSTVAMNFPARRSASAVYPYLVSPSTASQFVGAAEGRVPLLASVFGTGLEAAGALEEWQIRGEPLGLSGRCEAGPQCVVRGDVTIRRALLFTRVIVNEETGCVIPHQRIDALLANGCQVIPARGRRVVAERNLDLCDIALVLVEKRIQAYGCIVTSGTA